jgi:hypothetical protein
MTKADPMAASGQTSFDVQTEAHSLPSQNRGMVVQVAPVPLNAAKIELQESGITEKIQPSNGKTADSNSIMEEIKKTAKVKKRHLRPKHVKAPRKRGAQPENRNALKHGK